jgi:hypothetical protein
VTHCLVWEEEGIYRLSGSAAEIVALKHRFEDSKLSFFIVFTLKKVSNQ